MIEKDTIEVVRNHTYVGVGVAHHFVENRVFVHYGYAKDISKDHLILQTANGIQAVSIPSIIFIDKEANKFKELQEQRKQQSGNKSNYQGWQY